MTCIKMPRFRRKYSINPYKSMRLPMATFSCYKDWVHDNRGDPYPIVRNTGISEKINNQSWEIQGGNAHGEIARFLCSHFPICTYDLSIRDLNCIGSGGVGFAFCINALSHPEIRFLLCNESDELTVTVSKYISNQNTETISLRTGIHFQKGMHFIITANYSSFEIYFDISNRIQIIDVIEFDEFNTISEYHVFTHSEVHICADMQKNSRAVLNCEAYMDSGISQADLKIIRYEDGTPIIDNGRVYLSMSARNMFSWYQLIASWCPSACDMRMEGALFFDTGDGKWSPDISSSIIYNRITSEWNIWTASFSHGHILMHGTSKGDPRFGVNVVDMQLMQSEGFQSGVLSDDSLFFAKNGDEDPDFIYDSLRNVWTMAICRLSDTNKGRNKYTYYLFESTDPFSGYHYIGHTTDGEVTGGTLFRIENTLYLCAGADFDKRANYQLYPVNAPQSSETLHFDHDDGGFRGWGTLVQIPCGSRTHTYMITFDRHNGGRHNWSYGNLYVFEADEIY